MIESVLKRFPELTIDDVMIVDNGEEEIFIAYWNSDQPMPTSDDLKQWEQDDLYSLDVLKQNKLNELDKACNDAILGKFTADVDGITYSFSNDSEAQSNFKDAKLSYLDGDLLATDTVAWTAYDVNNVVVRLQLTKDQFNVVYIAHAMLALDCVSKLRDTLQPQVEAVTDVTQLDTIVW